MTPLVSTRVTVLLAVCLFTPFGLRTLSTRLEPYPAVLLPAGATRVRLNQSEVSFSRTTLTCRGRDGNWQPLDVTRLLSPIPPWYLHDIVSNEFGLKSTPYEGVSLQWVSRVITLPRHTPSDEELQATRRWLALRLAATPDCQPAIRIAVERTTVGVPSGHVAQHAVVYESIHELD